MNKDDRTNNYSEAGHKRVAREFAMEHPSIWKFIESIKKVQKGRDKVYEEMVMGNNPPKKRRIYREIDERIYKIVDEGLENRTVWEYMKGLANNYNMDK
jgi:hypothetical protein